MGSRSRTAPGSAAACHGEHDLGIWRSRGKSNFSPDLDSCGHECFGQSSCVADCMRKQAGYTAPCSKCFGEIAGCTFGHCSWQCAWGENPSCQQCAATNCNPAFTACSGLHPPAS